MKGKTRADRDRDRDRDRASHTSSGTATNNGYSPTPLASASRGYASSLSNPQQQQQQHHDAHLETMNEIDYLMSIVNHSSAEQALAVAREARHAREQQQQQQQHQQQQPSYGHNAYGGASPPWATPVRVPVMGQQHQQQPQFPRSAPPTTTSVSRYATSASFAQQVGAHSCYCDVIFVCSLAYGSCALSKRRVTTSAEQGRR